MRSTRSTLMSAALLVAAAAAPQGAAAQQEQEKPPLAAYRESLMEGLQSHNGALRALASGAVEYPGHVLGHAEAINHIAMMMADVFPEGSMEGSRAKAEIWQNWSDFDSKRMELVNASNTLIEAARGMNAEAIGEAARAVGQTCRGCHQTYRAPAN